MSLKRSRAGERYYTNKKYLAPEPCDNVLDYPRLVDFYGNYEYTWRLAAALSRSLKRSLGEARGTKILEYVKKGKIKIVNEKTYMQYHTVTTDIGSRAWLFVNGEATSRANVWQYLSEVTRLIVQRVERGEDHIDLSSVLFYLAELYKGLKENSIYYKENLEAICAGLAGAVVSYRKNPFVFHLFRSNNVPEMAKGLGLEFKNAGNYAYVVNTFMRILKHVGDKHVTKSYLPRLKLVVLLERDARVNEIRYLMRVFCLKLAEANKLFGDFPNLHTKSHALIAKLNEVKKLKNAQGVNIYRVVEKLERIHWDTPVRTYPTIGFDIRHTFSESYFDRALMDHLSIKIDYYYDWKFCESFLRSHATVEIDCTNLNKSERLNPMINAAAEVLMAQVRHALAKKHYLFKPDSAYLNIILRNVNDTSIDFINSIKEVQWALIRKYNKSFRVILNFTEEAARSPYGEGMSKYVRVISDIHADYNEHNNYIFNFGTDFVINAGDTSGDLFTTRDWIRTFMTQGVSVTGNHLGYTDLGEKALMTTKDGKSFNVQPKNGQQQYLQSNFEKTWTPVLTNDTYIYEGMFIIGTTLYTDFKLFGEQNKAACMMEASRCMNDFKYCSYYNAETKQIEPFTVETHAHLFDVCVGYIRNRLAEFRRRTALSQYKVVIVTHHAPLPYSVAPQYKNDPLSAAFASDLRWLIDEYPEIRLWCFGHQHNPSDFIYKECRFVSEPFGYNNENNFDIEEYGKRIKISDIIGNARWKNILRYQIETGKVQYYEE